jgi:hypothetical protein
MRLALGDARRRVSTSTSSAAAAGTSQRTRGASSYCGLLPSVAQSARRAMFRTQLLLCCGLPLPPRFHIIVLLPLESRRSRQAYISGPLARGRALPSGGRAGRWRLEHGVPARQTSRGPTQQRQRGRLGFRFQNASTIRIAQRPSAAATVGIPLRKRTGEDGRCPARTGRPLLVTTASA